MTGVEILYIILLAVLIVAVVFLILVLWRAFRILTNLDLAMEEVKKTTGKVTEFINTTVGKISELSANLGVFVKIAEKVSDSIKGYFENRNKSK